MLDSNDLTLEELDAISARIEAEEIQRATGMNTEEWEQYCANFLFPNEPSHFTFSQETLQELLVHCFEQGASDINFCNHKPCFINRHGLYHQVTKRNFSEADINNIITMVYGPSGKTTLKDMLALDPSYDITLRGKRYRFRVNVTACQVDGADAAQITIRTINSTPMSLKKMDVEPAIVENMKPNQGLIVICGPTGHGKSSLLAGIILSYLTDHFSHKKIITYEAPIEFVYDDVRVPGKQPSAFIFQSEIGRHLPSFAEGARNLLRRAPQVVLIGESRDGPTMEATLAAAETGHTIYTTVHANNSISDAFVRMLNMFGAEERSAKKTNLIGALRLIVIQRLERTLNGGRTAIREYLVFTPALRAELALQSDVKDICAIIDKAVVNSGSLGRTMSQSAKLKYDKGLFGEDVWNRYRLDYEKAQALVTCTTSEKGA